MPFPPLKDVLDALYHAVLPGAGGAALVACAFLLLGRWAGALGTAAAVTVGFAWGNFTLERVGKEPPTWANTWRLIPWAPEADAPGYQWLARAALVLVAVGLVSRWIGLLAARGLPERYWWGANLFVWAPRTAAVLVVSAWLVLGKAAEGEPWALLRWELVAAMLLLWLVLDGLARSGVSVEVAAVSGASLFAGGAVLLYAHNATFMELAVLVGSALFGVALAVALVMRSGDGQAGLAAGGALPAAVAFLPGLVLGTRPSHDDNNVPAVCFWLVALGPLLLAPFLVPRVSRQNRWVLLALSALLALTPLVAAVVLAGRHEKLPFEGG
jgi:hypothetical protein